MNLRELNNWLNHQPFYPIKNTIHQYIYDSYKRFTILLNNLDLKIKNTDSFEHQYILFLTMYSLKKFPIKLHKQFHREKDIRIFDTFGTFYGDILVQFIENEKNEFRNYGLDILQKKNFSMFLEFIIFTMKHVELDSIYYNI